MERIRCILTRELSLALGRLRCTINKLERNPQLLEAYAAIIHEQLERGIIEMVSDESPEGKALYTTPCCGNTKKGHHQVESSI